MHICKGKLSLWGIKFRGQWAWGRVQVRAGCRGQGAGCAQGVGRMGHGAGCRVQGILCITPCRWEKCDRKNAIGLIDFIIHRALTLTQTRTLTLTLTLTGTSRQGRGSKNRCASQWRGYSQGRGQDKDACCSSTRAIARATWGVRFRNSGCVGIGGLSPTLILDLIERGQSEDRGQIEGLDPYLP